MADISELKFRQRPLTNVLTAVRPGRYQTTPALGAVTTYKGFFTVQSKDYIDATPLIPNLGPAYTGSMRFSVVASTGGDNDQIPLTPAGGSWSVAMPVTVAAGGTSAGLNSETVVYTKGPRFDKHSIARTDNPTRNRAVIAWMLQVPAGTVMTVPNIGSYGWYLENQLWPQAKVTSQAVAGVDNVANFTNTARTPEGNPGGIQNPFHIGFQYTTSRFGKQLYNSGDSIVEGLGGADGRWLGAMQRAAIQRSTPDNPIEWFNGGQHAQTPDVYIAQMVQNLALVQPTAIFVSFYSINALQKSATSPGLSDTSKKDEIYRAIATASRVIKTLPRDPALFILPALPGSTYVETVVNGQVTASSGTSTGANDALRLALNLEYAAMGTDPSPSLTSGVTLNRQGFTVVKDYAETVSDPTPVNGQIVPIPALMGSDRVHWSDAGLNALAAKILPYIDAC
jgi:lysophospholipase L1-like esterase